MKLVIINRFAVLRLQRLVDLLQEPVSEVVTGLFFSDTPNDFLHEFEYSLCDMSMATLEDVEETVTDLLDETYFDNKYTHGSNFEAVISTGPWRLVIRIKAPV